MHEREDRLAELRKDLEAKKQCSHEEVEHLLKRIEQPHRVIHDSSTVTLATGSMVEFPQGFMDIGADFFFLDCCAVPQAMNSPADMNEVKAIGSISYVASFYAPTFYNNGQNHIQIVNHPFSCTGSVSVNRTLGYSPGDECPSADYCKERTEAYAYIKDIEVCSAEKSIITVGVLFILPDYSNPYFT
ncbi:hypothetical protein E2R51_12975 [Jeotgalibacillus sp. S-D1]|uniref:hypothetical protein n=1 Tax=Jeotgalibacillus sp. S-D1 TaxID=2552189 RepID=UPI001059C9C0|nr:hypothetical protein [Jeotgalibacillus sp. S-D1]TDL31282.1 hypothetical protein E2R51_12975 [Jeotgalibacillus sp. S-D1]